MIRPLRARHRALFVVLTLLLPAALTVALASRRAPATGELPDVLSGSTGESIAWSAAAELAGTNLVARQGRSTSGSRWVELVGAGPRRPDVLVYLAPVAPSDGVLPAGARLVGALGPTAPVPRVLALPAGAQGWLVLFSLGDSTALAALELEV